MSNVTQANRTERASVYTSSLCCMFNCQDTTAAFCPMCPCYVINQRMNQSTERARWFIT